MEKAEYYYKANLRELEREYKASRGHDKVYHLSQVVKAQLAEQVRRD